MNSTKYKNLSFTKKALVQHLIQLQCTSIHCLPSYMQCTAKLGSVPYNCYCSSTFPSMITLVTQNCKQFSNNVQFSIIQEGVVQEMKYAKTIDITVLKGRVCLPCIVRTHDKMKDFDKWMNVNSRKWIKCSLNQPSSDSNKWGKRLKNVTVPNGEKLDLWIPKKALFF